jgi:putative transcriptional regulator
MTEFEKDLLESICQAQRGEGRVTQVAVTAATKARLKRGVSQSAFAQWRGVSVRTLEEWAQGRREPSGAARTLLRIALKPPEAILQQKFDTFFQKRFLPQPSLPINSSTYEGF